MSRLTEFLKGKGPDDAGRFIMDVFKFDFKEFEENHDYIQWVFPNPEPSKFNPQCPLLTASDIEEIINSPEIQKNVDLMVEAFLQFLGLTCNKDTVYFSAFFSKLFDTLKERGFNHNHLRITRLLTFLVLIGRKKFATNLCNFLVDNGACPNDTTLSFWKLALLSQIPENEPNSKLV